MAYKYTTTHIVFEVGDKVTPDWIYFEGSEVMTPGRELTIRKIIDFRNTIEVYFDGLELPYEAHMFRLIDNTNIREVPL